MKKTMYGIFSFTLFLCSCLQSNYNVDLDAFTPAVVMDILANFSASGGSDMLLVTIQGGRFKDTVDASRFILKKGGSEIPLSVPVRDGDGMIIFGFSSPLSDGSYTLFINKEAFAEPAAKASAQAVKSGTWTDAGDGGFGRSRVWSMGYGNGKFVAVAANGKMAYSTNMGTWTAIRPGYSGIQTQFGDSDTDAIRGIAWGDNRFIAVGHKARVASSDDGISWQGWDESQFEGKSILCVTYGGDRFIAAGDSGKMNFKWNAGNWEKVTETRFGEKNILAIAHGNPGGQALFVAAGTDGQLAWSSNAWEWNWVDAGFGGSTIYGLAWGNNVFVAVGDQGKIAWSSDGKTWQLATQNAFNSSGVLGVAFGSGIFLAAGHDGKMAASADGISWQAILPGTGAGANQFSASEQIQTVCYGGGRFVAAGLPYPGSDRDIGRIVYSYQKPPVIQAPADTNSAPFTVLAGDNRIVITLAGGKFADTLSPSQFTVNGGTGGFSQGALSGRILEKSDSHVVIRLTSAAPSNGSGQTITVSASALAVLPASVAVSSEKEYVWKITPQNPFADSGISAIAHNGAGSVYIAVGGAKIAKSANGVDWTEIASTGWVNPTGNDYVLFTGIAWGDGRFTAVGYWVNGGADLGGGSHAGWGVSALSLDNGATWTLKDRVFKMGTDPIDISPQIYGIAHNGQTGAGSRFIAVGQWGRAAWSDDGLSWTPVQIAPFNYLDNPAYFEDALDITYGGGKFVVVGKNGKVAFSTDDGAVWTWNANILLGSGVHINTICFGNGTFIAAGNGGNMKTILAADIAQETSANGGEQWEGVDSKFSASGILDLAHNGSVTRSMFIAVGYDGKMSESGDGKNWMAVSSGNNEGQNKFEGREQISCIAWGNNRFVAGGNAYAGNTSKLTYSE
jgi:hypothetical protein